MYVGVFDLFKIGVGPSSSHTMGSMLAANRFLQAIDLEKVSRVTVDLYGSLSATGIGHRTDIALLCGLSGYTARTLTHDLVNAVVCDADRNQLNLRGTFPIQFNRKKDLVFNMEQLDLHPNGLTFTAFDATGHCLNQETFFSVGGGFVQTEDEFQQSRNQSTDRPYPFDSFDELLALCHKSRCSVSTIMLENEKVSLAEYEIEARCVEFYSVMRTCVETGIHASGKLPGGLEVKRRAPALYQRLMSDEQKDVIATGFQGMDWVNLYALAVNEENASGGRIITAPTNGAAGIVPAVLLWFADTQHKIHPTIIRDFFLTAAAIGSLCKRNASISGAEVGCQGEVGSACAMAAGGLVEIMGGTPEQVENAAEIGLEHNLGLTCDPIGGLIQIPCIERNAIAAVKAINAAHLALMGDGTHFVSFDKVVNTLRETGKDMADKYKETSRGGLAVNAVDC